MNEQQIRAHYQWMRDEGFLHGLTDEDVEKLVLDRIALEEARARGEVIPW